MPCVRRRARAKPSMGPLRGEGKSLGGVASRKLGFLCWTQNILFFRTRKNKIPCVRRRARAKPSMRPLRGEGKALGGAASRGLGFVCLAQNSLLFRTWKNKMPCVRRLWRWWQYFPTRPKGALPSVCLVGQKTYSPKKRFGFPCLENQTAFLFSSTDRLSFFPHCFPGCPAGAGPARGAHRPGHRNPADDEWF